MTKHTEGEPTDADYFQKLYARQFDINADLLEAFKDLVKAYEIKMGKSAIQLRIDLAKQAISKAEGK